MTDTPVLNCFLEELEAKLMSEDPDSPEHRTLLCITSALESAIERTKMREVANARGQQIPEGWRPSDNVLKWAQEKFPEVDLSIEGPGFIDYWRAATGKGSRKRDWTAAFRTWIRRAATNGFQPLRYSASARRQAGEADDFWSSLRKEAGKG